MRQKKDIGLSSEKMDSSSGGPAETPRKPEVIEIMDTETPAVNNEKKLTFRRAKKKTDLNISKGKLKSVTAKNFSYLNMSVQKQTLRANNRALAQNLAKAREEKRQLNAEIQRLRVQNQDQHLELNRLKRIVGLKDEEIQAEVQRCIQDEMKEIRNLMDGLAQSMMYSSTFIDRVKDRCLAYCPRRSTDSTQSRASSLGMDQRIKNFSTRLQQRDSTESSGKDQHMANYLSKADEFAVPPGAQMYNDGNNECDLSMIAEQSMLDPTQEIYTASRLTSVDEITNEISPREPAVALEQISKLPQRVLKYPSSGKANTNANEVLDIQVAKSTNSTVKSKEFNKLGDKIPMVTDTVKLNSDRSEAENGTVPTTKSKQKKVKSDIKEKSEKTKTTAKAENADAIEKTKPLEDKTKFSVKAAKTDTEKTQAKVVETSDNGLDADISAFGFGGDFAADLVSGSPISKEKRRETFVKPKQTSMETLEKEMSDKNDEETDVAHKRRETFTKPKPVSAKMSVSESFISPDAEDPKKRSNIQNVEVKSDAQGKENKKHGKNGHINVKASSKDTDRKDRARLNTVKGRRETYLAENPFLPKTVTVIRSPTAEKSPMKKLVKQQSPVKEVLEQEPVFENVKDPFKPTKTLIRSPVRITLQNASPVQKIDSTAFLATLRESSGDDCRSPQIGEMDFPDEATTYFNSEMEFTSVIDSTKFLQSLSNRSERSSPVAPNDKDNNLSTRTDRRKASASNSKEGQKEPAKTLNSETQQKDESDTVAVEVRTKKPGVFTFSVGRKEADGTRKPVPEKVSKARSKKKKAVSPEKEERKVGEDRDMFNFGDRTPTMPLDKLAKSKNVYDLSMNESVAGPPGSLKDLRENGQLKIPAPKPDEHIYYLPLPKGSPDEKPVSKRSRSQSRSRSKPRKTSEEEDEDWVPGGRSRAKSRSKSRARESDPDAGTRRGRSRSRLRAADEVSDNEDKTDAKIETCTRPKSQDRKESEEHVTRRGRSQSRRRVVDESDKEDEEKEKDQKERKTGRRSQSISRRITEDEESGHLKSDTECVQEDNASNKEKSDNSETEVSKVQRRGRSQSRARVQAAQEDDKSDSVTSIKADKSEMEASKRRGRSKSRARVNSEEIDTETDDSKTTCKSNGDKNRLNAQSPVVVRRSARSKSQLRKIVVYSDEDDSDEDDYQYKNSPVDKRKSRSRSLHKRKSTKEDELKVDGRNKSECSDDAGKQADSVSISKNLIENLRPVSRSRQATKSTAIVLDSESESRESSNDIESIESEEYLEVENKPNQKAAKHKMIVIEDSDSDFESVEKMEKTRRKSKRRAKSAKYDEYELSVEEGEPQGKEKKADVGKLVERCSNEMDVKSNVSEKVESGYINKRRGRSLKNLNTVDLDEADDSEKEMEVGGQNCEISVESNSALNEVVESPKNLKMEKKKSTKSTKKSTKKKVPEDQEKKTGKSRTNMAEKFDALEQQEGSEDSMVTPALATESKKSAKTSRTAKSSKKIKAEPLPDQTPCHKEQRTHNQPAEDLTGLELLKKRLTMVGCKQMKADNIKEEGSSRKRPKTEAVYVDEQSNDRSESPDNKRSRRNKNPVSYVPKPLNVKLRQGDQMFQETAASRVKLEQTRLLIAKKTSVPKISRDDKENLEQT